MEERMCGMLGSNPPVISCNRYISIHIWLLHVSAHSQFWYCQQDESYCKSTAGKSVGSFSGKISQCGERDVDVGPSLYHQRNSSFIYKEGRSDWYPDSSIHTGWHMFCLMSRFPGSPNLDKLSVLPYPFPWSLKWLQVKCTVWVRCGGWSHSVYFIAQI